jgi:hypothetical protein
VQGFTTAGRPDWRTAHSALRSTFMDVADFRAQRELARAKPRLRDLAVHTRARSRTGAESSGSEVDRVAGQLLVRGSAHRSMRRIVLEAVSLRQLVLRLTIAGTG